MHDVDAGDVVDYERPAIESRVSVSARLCPIIPSFCGPDDGRGSA